MKHRTPTVNHSFLLTLPNPDDSGLLLLLWLLASSSRTLSASEFISCWLECVEGMFDTWAIVVAWSSAISSCESEEFVSTFWYFWLDINFLNFLFVTQFTRKPDDRKILLKCFSPIYNFLGSMLCNVIYCSSFYFCNTFNKNLLKKRERKLICFPKQTRLVSSKSFDWMTSWFEIVAWCLHVLVNVTRTSWLT